MKIKILGSGGCTSLPRPCCYCDICEEAREKGEPYKRSSCSIFIEDLNLLIDTPEDISYSLNRERIRTVDRLMYSHWDPDHTLGIRVIEQLRLNWFKYFNNERCTNPIQISALPEVLDDIYKIENKFGSYLSYYESLNLCSTSKITEIIIGDIKISLVPIVTNIVSTAFVFESSNSKVVYAPCDNKPLPDDSRFYDADIFIMGGFIPTTGFNGGTKLASDNKIFDAMLTLDELKDIKNTFRVDKMILTHLEEDWGLSYTDYENLNSDDITFAYDGMTIEC